MTKFILVYFWHLVWCFTKLPITHKLPHNQTHGANKQALSVVEMDEAEKK